MRKTKIPKPKKRLTPKEFIKIVSLSVGSTLYRGKTCLYFGSFREEENDAEQRCLLSEYPPKKLPYLLKRRHFADACHYHDRRCHSHCTLEGELTPEQLHEIEMQKVKGTNKLRKKFGYQ